MSVSMAEYKMYGGSETPSYCRKCGRKLVGSIRYKVYNTHTGESEFATKLHCPVNFILRGFGHTNIDFLPDGNEDIQIWYY